MGGEPSQDAVGQLIEGRHTGHEGARRLEPLDDVYGQTFQAPASSRQAASRTALFPGARSGPSAAEIPGKRLDDEGPGSPSTLEIALGGELLDGLKHGVARDVEVDGQRARRRKASARCQDASQDRVEEGGIELTVQRRFASSVERAGEEPVGCCHAIGTLENPVSGSCEHTTRS